MGIYLAKATLGALSHPLYTTWLIQHIDPKARATVLSMVSQADAFGQIAGGPGIGLIGNAFSLRAAIVAAGMLLSPASLLYARMVRGSETDTTRPKPETTIAAP